MLTPIYIEPSKRCLPHPWHPSVIHAPKGWNGRPYWMVETPFPPFYVAPYKDRWELPCIHYSKDGIHWSNIGRNPIADISADQIAGHGYLSDPHLVLSNGQLECWYRRMLNHDAQTTILRKISTNGIEWGEEQIVADTLDKEITNNLGGEIISPAILWKEDTYVMYYVDDTFTNLQRGIKRTSSTDGKHWSKAESIKLQIKNYKSKIKNQKSAIAIIPWHIDIQYIRGTYYLLVHDVDHNLLALFTSVDGATFDFQQIVLQASNKWMDFFSHKLYRACLIEVDGKIRIYFSANNGMASYIGLMEQAEDGSFYIIDCQSGKQKAVFVFRFIWLRCRQFVQRCTHFIDKHIIHKLK